MICKYDPYILCIQESRIPTLNIPKLKNYQIFFTNSNNVNHASGGVLMCIKNNIKANEIILNTNLQAVAVTIEFPQKHTICNVYIPPQQQIHLNELHQIMLQLPQPFIILGDMNAHNPLWGSVSTDRRGKVFEEFLLKTNLICLNDGTNTHITLANGTQSAIDLTLTTPNLFMDLTWKTEEDLYNSDHFPIIITFTNINISQSRRPKWIMEAANWKRFEEESENITATTIHQFTSSIIETAHICIPQTSSNVHKRQVPWWNNQINELIKIRKKMLRIFRLHPTINNNIEFKKARAKARKEIERAKKTSWTKYIESIDQNTSSKDFYVKINRIRGNYKSISIPIINVNQMEHTDPHVIANLLGKEFQDDSSSQNYNNSFESNINSINEMLAMIEHTNIASYHYNSDFTINELHDTLRKCKGSSPGPDGVHYDMIKHLSHGKKLMLLQLINDIWTQRTNFPEEWRKAIIIPILKPNKESTSVESYRPIALTSCMCKIMEGMVNSRLVWILEDCNFINKNQAGFRRHHSTTDHLATLESDIQFALQNKKHLIAVFFDISKAYQMVWRPIIFESLRRIGIKNNLFCFINNFLSERTFKVANGNSYSEDFLQENGIPQGSKISVTLFLIAINSVMNNVIAPVKGLLFADDLVIYMEHNDHDIICQHLQRTINKLEKWSNESGFIFNTSKTKIVHFCRKYKPHRDPEIKLFNHIIPVSESNKFLGLVFDKKLTWVTHIKNIYKQSMSNLNIIKILSNKKYGIEEQHLYKVYNNIILSRIDYGSVAYNSANKTTLNKLEVIQNACLRMITGAFRSSPVDSILSISGYTTLNERRKLTTLIYTCRIMNRKYHPLHIKFDYCQPDRKNKDFVSRACVLLEEYDIIFTDKVFVPEIAPWSPIKTQFHDELCKLRKGSTTKQEYHQKYRSLCHRLTDFIQIYTDGSKTDQHVGSAFVTMNTEQKWNIPLSCSIFTAESFAILNAIKYASQQPHNNYAIFTDSSSVLHAIKNRQHKNKYIIEIQNILSQTDKDLRMIWIPSHIGIINNEKADRAAQDAAHLTTEVGFIVPATDIVSLFKQKHRNKWQAQWSDTRNNKLREIKDTSRKWSLSSSFSRPERQAITRLRIGHTHTTHQHLMKKEPPEICRTCNTLWTVKHILLHCDVYKEQRLRCKLKNNLRDILRNDDPKQLKLLITFLHNTDLINMI